ncbi:DUF1963 domain-containing protein [Nonomuraea guangzhouensis]|uniref:DUF1963 domain-containing protein n=1 Tax=Nonomuraea guangzhouensis TaxID=1291555 RepID=UPI001C5DD1B3|nr:DUF1963 domain-containing protein [Nonomuraea guangzhouensis]
MARHTPPRPVAVEALFPELKPLSRSALRLHPRAGTPSYEDSSVGGPLRWPADEPWPLCAEEHYYDDGLEDATRHEAVVPMVPVVQLYAADAPGVPFPQGSDLLQVLWCPFNHGDDPYERCPLPQVRWRNVADVRHVLATPPEPADAPEGHVPIPCVVHPEQVTEYPDWDDIPQELRDEIDDRLHRLEETTGWDYFYHLSTAPGTKVGGHPRGWNGSTTWFSCERCGQPIHHLLTVAYEEFDGKSWQTWLPVEDRPDDNRGPELYLSESERAAAAENPPGLMVSGGGSVYLFECRSCPDRPVEHLFYLN